MRQIVSMKWQRDRNFFTDKTFKELKKKKKKRGRIRSYFPAESLLHSL